MCIRDRLEQEAKKYIEQIDKLGGAVVAIEQGFQQREINEAAYQMQLEIEKGSRLVVGVNAFQSTEEPPIEILRIDPKESENQIARLNRVKAKRNSSEVEAALANLSKVARSEDNTMPAIIECVEALATTG